jgi:DnaA-homolog protein
MMRQLAFELVQPVDPTFGNFVAGRNAEVKHRLQSVAAGTSDEHYIYVWGVPGSGRTHLLKAIQAGTIAAGRACAYLACDTTAATMPTTDTLDCLLVDDVERLPPDGQIALFNAYNAMRERGAALVAAGDAPAVQLPLRADVITRLGWGLVYQLHALTDEEKMQALCDYAQQLGFELDDGIADYLLRHVARDMGSLLAMLRAMDRYSLEAKRPVTLALVRELVRAKISPTQ